tara:strand:- start:354 stop:590 length:237 start_codon:yes stop_codon:yes gene_type:complete
VQQSNKRFKPGDLVNFEAKAWVFSGANRRYKNPGIVIKVGDFTGIGLPVARVMWADGKFTSEYAVYLHSAENTGEENE